MLNPRLMLIMAQSMLVVGSCSLVFAAWRLFHRALAGGMPATYLWWIVPVVIIGGAGKARFVMRRRMRANIARLAAATEKMWPWQIYPPQLLTFIISMVILMFVMKRVLADHPLGLGLLGGVDLGIAMALVVASFDYVRIWPALTTGK